MAGQESASTQQENSGELRPPQLAELGQTAMRAEMQDARPRLTLDLGKKPSLHDGMVEALYSDGKQRWLETKSRGHPDGWPILTGHGTPGSPLGPNLRSSILYTMGIREISIARPGYADSPRDEGRRVADCAAYFHAVAKAYGISRFSVAGRSGGAPGVLACAALLPGLVVNAAVFSCPAPPGSIPNWQEGLSEGNIEAYTAAITNPEAMERHFAQIAEASRTHSDAVLKEIEGGMSDADRRYLEVGGMRRLIAECHADGMKNGHWGRYDDIIAARQPWGFDPRDISVPVLLAQGEEDTFTLPREFEWLTDKIPTALGELHPGMGHMGTLDLVRAYYRVLVAQAQQLL